MSISTEIASRFWNLPQKADEETDRELLFIDDIIQKSHIEREILSRLDGVKTVFDGGAGYGRFSILLAKRGLKVTHFDISLPMIEKAKALAVKAGVLEQMTFVDGSLEDLSMYHDGQFDMVLSFDAPISYTYPKHEKVIGELIRICGKQMIIGVYSRLGWTYLFDPAQKLKYILDKNNQNPIIRWTIERGVPQLDGFRPDMADVQAFFKTGLMETQEETVSAYKKGKTPWPISYAFMPDELENIFKSCGVGQVKLAGPGALSRSIPEEVLQNIMKKKRLKCDFLDFCYWYDSQPWCAGMGKDNILASADIIQN